MSTSKINERKVKNSTYKFSYLLIIAILSTVISILLAINGTLLNQNQKTDKTPTRLPESRLVINNWFMLAESDRFKIYNSGVGHGSITTVVDKLSGNLYIPDKSCEIEIPEKEKQQSKYFNNSIGIINAGPYKTITQNKSKEDNFFQSFSYGGCSGYEGEIFVYLKDSKLLCDINIFYKSDCQ